MFELLPPETVDVRDLDDATLVDTITRWARASAMADARKFAAIADLQRRRCVGEHPNWACDDWDAATAEVAAALDISHGRASGDLDIAVMLRDRFPRIGALFLAGELTARRVWLIANRTYLVTDRDALAELDSVIADRITRWGPLSEYKLTQAIDVWVDEIDPGALRRTRNAARTRDFVVGEADHTGTADVRGRLLASDAALLERRVEAMARGVCGDDPRTLAQRRADAMGALGAGFGHLCCKCDDPDCSAATNDGRASSIVVHVIAEAASIEAQPDPHLDGEGVAPSDETEPPVRRKAALIAGGGPVPAPLLAELVTRGARISPVRHPGRSPEARYRPSAALDEFIRVRDLTCRFPGCDRPATFGDIDHTVAYPGGPTHAGNLKCYCRKHHLIKTFWPGWSDRQMASGEVIVATPTGHTYSTAPGASLFFPSWAVDTPAPASTPAAANENRASMMPKRRRTRAQSRADRVRAERALSDAHVAERNRPPPF